MTSPPQGHPLPTYLARPFASKVPDVIDALVALWRAAFSVTDPPVIVRDGPWTGGETADQEIVVGWYGIPPGYQTPRTALNEAQGLQAATSSNPSIGQAPSQQEAIRVNCSTIARAGGIEAAAGPGWTANEGSAPARRLAFGNLALAARALAGNPSLNGVLADHALIGAVALHQMIDRRGAIAIVTFTVEGTGFSQQ